jgi:hypothetical protein
MTKDKNKISKIHQAFSEELNKPEALTNPEKYLGPNWEDVLNFWIYVDTLSDEERKEMSDRYWELDNVVLDSSYFAARNAAEEVVGEDFRYAAWLAAWFVTGRRVVFGNATEELIGYHKLLEQGKLPLALQYCSKS